MNSKHSFSKIWEVLKPLLLYYILFNVVFILLLSLCRAVAEGLGNEYLNALTEHADTVTGLVSGLAMIVSVLPMLPMLRRELAAHKGSADEVNEWSIVQESDRVKSGGALSDTIRSIGLTVVLAVSASLGLNVLLALTGMVEMSAGYQEVADRQYGVAFGFGILLYGVVSPVTEEIVFRGLVFNRMRRYMPHTAAMIASGVLFGVYHGNPVQGLYGGCMGILMAYLYERLYGFFFPCLFHATANLIVYATAQNGALHGLLFTVPGCAGLLIVSAICLAVTEKRRCREDRSC